MQVASRRPLASALLVSLNGYTLVRPAIPDAAPGLGRPVLAIGNGASRPKTMLAAVSTSRRLDPTA